MLETWVLVYTGAYYVWLVVWDKYKKFMKSDDLLKNLEKEVNRIKGKVKDSRKKRLDRNLGQKTDQGNTDTNGNKPQGRSLQNVHNSALSTEREGLQEQGSDTSKAEVESRTIHPLKDYKRGTLGLILQVDDLPEANCITNNEGIYPTGY